MAGELRDLAQFVYDLKLETVPEKVTEAARFCVLDTIGSALGAAESPQIHSIGENFEDWCGPGKNGKKAAAWANGKELGLFSALMVNGCMAHELELDDVHTASKSHPGAVVVTAAWTMADALGADGKTFLEAVIAGYEVLGRVGWSMDVASNRKRGWHTTGIIGTFGAAGAVSKLMGLNVDQMVSAFGMAGTQSSGLWAFLAEGSTCKKLHPARAAMNGTAACILALSGMTGPEHILDAKDGGLYQAVSDTFDMGKLCKDLGKRYVITEIDKKPYPCCRTTHHAIDAALKLRKEEHVKPDEIITILVETYEVGVLQCGFTNYPGNGVEAKFSIPYTCAAAFVKGKVTVAEFSDSSVADPQIRRIAEAVTVKSDPFFTERYPKRWGSRMTVTLKNGEKKVCQIDDMSGSVAVPLSKEQETDKFEGLAQVAFSVDRAKEIEETILKIEKVKELPDLS